MILSTFKDTLHEILKNSGMYIAIAIAGIIVLTLIALLIVNRKKK